MLATSVIFFSYNCAASLVVVLNKHLQQHCIFPFVYALIKKDSLQAILSSSWKDMSLNRISPNVYFHCLDD